MQYWTGLAGDGMKELVLAADEEKLYEKKGINGVNGGSLTLPDGKTWKSPVDDRTCYITCTIVPKECWCVNVLPLAVREGDTYLEDGSVLNGGVIVLNADEIPPIPAEVDNTILFKRDGVYFADDYNITIRTDIKSVTDIVMLYHARAIQNEEELGVFKGLLLKIKGIFINPLMLSTYVQEMMRGYGIL